MNYSNLDERLQKLENNEVDREAIAKGVEKYMKANPITTESIGALPSGELPNAIQMALTEAKERGIFDGVDGQDGYTPQKSIDYFYGEKGADSKDGISVIHKLNGTVLEIISASGTSSVDLKGEKGDQGIQGEKSVYGAKGTIKRACVDLWDTDENTSDKAYNL